MKKLLLLAAAASLMAACSESSTAPAVTRKVPSARANDIECASGYIVAYDEYGNPYCVPDGGDPVPGTAPLAPSRPSRP